MVMVTNRFTLLLVLVVISISFSSSFSQVRATSETNLRIQSFSSDLSTLQTQIGYKFNNTNLLRRAMTHASFSQENNKALSIFGTHIIETSVSLHYLTEDIDASSKALNRLIAQVSNVESSCALDGGRLGLGKIIRVSPKTDASNPAILCGGFRAIVGAIAIDDAGTVDKAINVFWKVHGDRAGRLVSIL
ncbi:PREDICTED: protein NUCLEAR FUSION DEFECTIVE 2 isoform X2 [Camelina sativa]|uniref:Protein NUCLEAR FUSION DEFECTIVE 2 isoform X2 n=1 Tax=Camelina sativa TaxID=90675 RepID=A0ABM0WYK1_CAMSA|nr:PREDICTED: protein NUCLEAR FUSION DEFECTIVE 2 isoform X2 [Camelina sativa]